jgi:glycosyltransferase involved in cell wall biosynthesis
MNTQNTIPRISIALATYNGAKYLREQLESLNQQMLPPLELVACDDGSTDSSVDILAEFKKVAPFPVHVYVNDRTLGYADNFLKAASLCKGDWISFCDQDDVWLSNKLSTAARSIDKHRDAILILQNSYLCTATLKHSGQVFPALATPGKHAALTMPNSSVWNGFLQTVRRDLFDLAPLVRRPTDLWHVSRRQAHDHWTYMVASTLGEIVVRGEPVALYRRHPRAVTIGHLSGSYLTQVVAAMSNNCDSYVNLARFLLNCAEYFRDISTQCEDQVWRNNLSAAAFRAEQTANILLHRAAIYESAPIATRINHFRQVLYAGGYMGKLVHGMGPRSAVKDLAAVIGFF